MTRDLTYPETTKSLQADPEVSHIRETASVSFLEAFPTEGAACVDVDYVPEWVPTRERPVVPPPLAQLCSSCPVRQQCLTWALREDELGYWAGTTTKDREAMSSVGQSSVETADWMQLQQRQVHDGGPMKHAVGEGTLQTYRQLKCRCEECREANSAARAIERQRARARKGAA